MKDIKRVLVYCASSSKINEEYMDTAQKLGELLAEKEMELIYGGGSVGLMGVLADSVLNNGGVVRGLIPKFMVEVEWQHNGLTELILTETMHERKEQMAEMADAIVALPGGVGTLEELLEIITWKQLGIHNKPIIIVNTRGYYDALIAMFDRAAEEMFIRPQHLNMWSVVNSAEEVFDAINRRKEIHEDMRNYAKI